MTARDRTVLIVVLALAALGAGWLLVVSPKRATAAKLSSSIQAAQRQLAGLQAQVAADQRARASFSTHYVELAQLGEAVPQDDNVPSLLVELQGAAKASGIDFRGLQVTGGGSSGPSTAATASTSASASASAAATQLPPGVTGSAGFGAEQFTFTFSGGFFALSDFLRRVEDFVVANGALVRVSGRLMTLNAISLGPSTQGFPQMNASVSATTYLLPASQGLFDGATPAGPASAASGGAPAATATAPAGLPSTGAPAAPSSTPGATTTPSSASSAPTPSSSTSTAPNPPSGAAAAPSAAISAAPAISGGSR